METKQIIEDIKTYLDLGIEVNLECIDKDSYSTSYVKEIILESSLCVDRISDYDTLVAIKNCDYVIKYDDLKYFKIKEPTFNDLINVATKAVKDDIITIQKLNNQYLSFTSNECPGDIRGYSKNSLNRRLIKDGIVYIKNLYKETFTIENEEDIKKIKEGDIGKLSNGNEFTVIETNFTNYCLSNVIKVSYKNNHSEAVIINNISIFELKDAIITQQLY